MVWGEASGSESRVRGVTYISDPVRNWGSPPLAISPAAPTPVPTGGSLDFSVQAFDNDGQVVTDASFEWVVFAGTGNGKILPLDRLGQTARLHNGVFSEQTGTFVPAPGQCQVGVRATLWGEERIAVSNPVDLQ